MFEAAELGHTVDERTYARKAPKLREALLEAQLELKERGPFPVVILINGVDGAGKGETVNLLNAWMDPRLIQTHAFGPASDEERDRPAMWRYWQALPPAGRIGILFGSWYSDPILERVQRRITRAELDRAIEHILELEQLLVADGTLLLKFWFHLSKKQQKRRLGALANDKRTAWRVTRQDLRHFERYDAFRAVSEHVLRETSTGAAPWIVVEGADERYRSLTVADTLLKALEKRLRERPGTHRPPTERPAPLLKPVDGVRILDRLDLSVRMSKAKYEIALEKWQGKLSLLSRAPAFKKSGLVVVFEGNDAAGKGGAIRRVTGALDARQYDIIPTAAPTDEERKHPYLWRFWRHVPRHGRITIFDRSWYGRVLVERVEGFCDEAAFMRAYEEINSFEEQLVEHDLVLVKLWLAISADEQLARFKARQATGFKRYKITKEDWRNRKQWGAYVDAASDMVERTSTDIAPWTLIEANDKHHARIKVLKTLVEAMEAHLE